MTRPDPLPARVDRWLREGLGWSRRAIGSALAEGRVAIESPGEAIHPRFPDALVLPGDSVRVDETVVPRREPEGVWMLHKPSGIVSTRSDPGGRPCLGSWLEAMAPQVFPVGRLDAPTTGLLLLTDDGDLAQCLLHPRHAFPKTYVLNLDEAPAEDDPRLRALVDGVALDDGPARADSVWKTAPDEVRLVIREGRHRVVRRMAAAAGLPLRHLHRAAIGRLTLGDLEVGGLRRLDDDGYAALWEEAGGLARVRAARVGALLDRARHLRETGRADRRLDAWCATFRGPGGA